MVEPYNHWGRNITDYEADYKKDLQCSKAQKEKSCDKGKSSLKTLILFRICSMYFFTFLNCSWIKKGPEHVVHLKCKGRYGYEYILKEVSKYFQMKASTFITYLHVA